MVDIKSFETGLMIFEMQCGRYPSQDEGLSALVTRPPNIAAATWRGPYCESIPKDPWGSEYVYRYPGIHNKGKFDLYSLGEDRISKSGGIDADDINNWDEARSWLKYYTRFQITPQLVLLSLTVLAIAVGLVVFLRAKWGRSLPTA